MQNKTFTAREDVSHKFQVRQHSLHNALAYSSRKHIKPLKYLGRMKAPSVALLNTASIHYKGNSFLFLSSWRIHLSKELRAVS